MAQDDNHWCELGFAEPAVVFKGPTQTARSVTEAWVALHGFCPNCSADRPNGPFSPCGRRWQAKPDG